jgi:hypothetical protein
MGGFIMSKVFFRRIADSTSIDQFPVEDGCFWITGDGRSFIDYDNDRIPIAGTPDTQMSNSSRNAVENKVIKEYVDTRLSLYETKGKIIWTNPNPTNNFDAQTITLDESLDNYDEYEILVLQSTTNSRLISTGRIPVGHGTIISYNTSSYLYRPTGTIVSGDTISFEDGKGVVGTTVTVQNESIVPMYVIGYNTGLFE